MPLSIIGYKSIFEKKNKGRDSYEAFIMFRIFVCFLKDSNMCEEDDTEHNGDNTLLFIGSMTIFMAIGFTVAGLLHSHLAVEDGRKKSNKTNKPEVVSFETEDSKINSAKTSINDSPTVRALYPALFSEEAAEKELEKRKQNDKEIKEAMRRRGMDY